MPAHCSDGSSGWWMIRLAKGNSHDPTQPITPDKRGPPPVRTTGATQRAGHQAARQQHTAANHAAPPRRVRLPTTPLCSPAG